MVQDQGPCAFLALASPDPDVFLEPYPFLHHRRPLWDPGCSTLPLPLSGCENPRAVSQVPSTLRPHLPALLSLPSLWLCGHEVAASRIPGRKQTQVLSVCSPLIYQGHPLLSISEVTLGEAPGGGPLSDPPLCLLFLSDFTSPTQGSPLSVRGGKPQTLDTGVKVSQ